MSIPEQFYMAADWSYLLPDIVRLISNRLPTIEDYTAFTAMCQSFRSATAGGKRPTNNDVSQPPWLLLSCVEKDSSGRNSPAAERGLLSMYRHRNKFFLNLPELNGRHCWGSRYGWILTLGLDRQLHLFNPSNRRRIALPEQICNLNGCWKHEEEKSVWLRKYSIERALLIKLPPSSSFSAFYDFTVAAIRIGELRVIRPDGWIEVRCLGSHGYVVDVICYKGQIYALSHGGRLDICSNFGSLDPPAASEFVAPHQMLYCGNKFYVVESLGELLLVVRFWKSPDTQFIQFMCRYDTYRFDVYKLDFQTRKWTGIENLGNCTLFVGGCESLSLPRPEIYNCRKNCIYFTDDHFVGIKNIVGHDMGIYDVEEKVVEPFYSGDDSFSSYSAPTWLVPNFT